MIQVKANPDDTFAVTLSERAQRVLKRWSDENSLAKAKQLEDIITDFFQNKIHEYKNRDGPLMAEKYEALDDADKSKIDKILASAPTQGQNV